MIKFYATNLVDQAVLSASTENLLFPKSNIQHMFRTKVFRSTTNSDSVTFDLGETSQIDSVIVVPHTRDGFGFNAASLKLNGTSNFASPAFTQALTLNHTHGFGYAEFTEKEYRFANIAMTSTSGFCELANIFLGKKIEFESGTGVDFGWTYQDDELSIVKRNAYGQRFTDVKTRQRKFGWSLKSLNKDELDQVFELYDLCGETKPFFFRLGDDTMINDPDRFAGMFFLSSVPVITNKAFNLYDLSMSVEEAM